MPVCASCAAQNTDGARFCSTCGTPLQAPRPVDGERKFATVLFADVVRSTALAGQLDPEDWAAVMNGAFGFINSAITRFGGTVARLMGDGVLAFFGAPVAHEDDAARAVRAGLAILESAREYGRAVRDRHGIDFELRVGINTGTAVLAYVGDAVKAEYTAMGDTANVAARLQSVARPGTLLITDDTRRLVRGLFELAPRGEVTLKGKTEPVETFEVLSTRATPGPTRGVEGLASPLVGREAELARLTDAVSGLRSGRGAVVALVGDAGIGKSRLLAELRDRADPQEIGWYEGRAVSYGQSLAYYPWQQVGRALIGALASEGGPALRERLAAFVRDRGLPADHVPLLETILAVETEQTRRSLDSLDGDELADRIASAVIDALRSATRAGPAPVALVFDDLHWADGASLDLIARVATITASEPLLVVCVLRPERAAPSWALLDRLEGSIGESFRRLDLKPLDPDRSRELLANLLRIEGLADATRAFILQRAEGNPFFLEEVIRSLIDSGHVVRENGHWRAVREIAEATIPDTLAGVLSSRIDRLPHPTKRVAQTAAVIGRRFGYRALTAVCRSGPEPERIENVDPHLGTLTYEELVREGAREPEREYVFKHELTREAAYGLLLRDRRRELHVRTGTVLEEMFADRLEELAAVLAHHFHEGGDAERTARYALKAAERAVALSALPEALDHYARALDALDAMPDAPPEAVMDGIVGWTVVRYRLRRYDGLVERLERAEAVARERNDGPRLARILSWVALVHMVTGFPSRAEPALRESSELASSLGMEQLMLLPFFFVTESLIDRDPGQAAEQFEEVIRMARRRHMREVEGHALASSAVAHARLGHFAKARERIDEALAAAPSGGHKVKEADVYMILAGALYELGEIDEGLRLARLGAEMAHRENALECACAGYYGVGMGQLERRQLNEALRSFDRSLEFGEQAGWSGLSGFISKVRAGRALTELEGGSVEAVPTLERLLATTRAEHDDYGAALVALKLARARAAAGDTAAAEAHIEEALEYYARTGMKPYEARALELRGRILEAAGRDDEASAARERAAELRASLGLAPAGG